MPVTIRRHYTFQATTVAYIKVSQPSQARDAVLKAIESGLAPEPTREAARVTERTYEYSYPVSCSSGILTEG